MRRRNYKFLIFQLLSWSAHCLNYGDDGVAVVSETVTGVDVGAGGSAGVFVGSGVLVGGTGVLVGTGVSVGGTGVFVGSGVLVGGTAVGGFLVLVGVGAGGWVGASVGLGLGVLVGATVGTAVGGGAGGGGTMLAMFSAFNLTTSDATHTRKKLALTLSGAF